MKTKLLIVSMVVGAFAATAVAAEDGRQGQGAGGARAEHASEQGLEKGKAWAGTRDQDETGKTQKKKEMERVEAQEKWQTQEQSRNAERQQKQQKAAKPEKSKQGKGK